LSRHAARALSGNDRTSFYDEIVSNFIGELVTGSVPWAQPRGTAAAKAPLAMPKNVATSRCYSGIDPLECRRRARLPVQRWVTFHQALSLGANVRKGDRGTMVAYADRFIPEMRGSGCGRPGISSIAAIYNRYERSSAQRDEISDPAVEQQSGRALSRS